MLQATTVPYVKQLDANGVVINPVSKHGWDGNNRRTRRQPMQKQRAMNNSGNHQLFVNISHKWKKSVQTIRQQDGSIKRINHLIFVN